MTIKTITNKNGSVSYREQVYLGIDTVTGKQVQTTVTAKTKTELREKAMQKMADFKANGSTVFKLQKVETYRELVQLWLPNYKLTVKPQTYKHTVITINKHLMPIFADIRLDRLSMPFVQYFVNNLASSGLKKYKHIIALNRRVLGYAVHLQLIPTNPADNIILPRQTLQQTEKAKHLTDAQLKQFLGYLDTLPNTYKNNYNTVLYKFLLATGCRIGEVIALLWSDIDLEKGTVSISKTYNPTIEAISTPKTKAGTRVISIDYKTVLMLRLYKVRQAQKFKKDLSPYGDHVFSNGLAPYQARHNLQRMLDNHLARAGLPRFTFHAFRHTHASLLLNAGITYKELQYRLGHSKIAMTLDTYSHLSEEKEKEVIGFFEKAINNL